MKSSEIDNKKGKDVDTMNKTIFICQLPQATQDTIRNQLVKAGFDSESIELAMNSRLCDLEDTIEINLNVA